MKLQIYCKYCKLPCTDVGYHEICRQEVEAYIPERSYPITFLYYTEKDELQTTKEKWLNLAYNRLGIKIDIPKAKELLRYLLQETGTKLPLLMIVKSPQEAINIAKRLHIPRNQNLEIEDYYDELQESYEEEFRKRVSQDVAKEFRQQVQKDLEIDWLQHQQENTNVSTKEYKFTEILGIHFYEKLVKYDYFDKIHIVSKRRLERLLELTVKSNIFAGIYTRMLIILVEYPVTRDEKNYIFSDGTTLKKPFVERIENGTLLLA